VVENTILIKTSFDQGGLNGEGRKRSCPADTREAGWVLLNLWTQLFFETPQLAAAVPLLVALFSYFFVFVVSPVLFYAQFFCASTYTHSYVNVFLNASFFIENFLRSQVVP
jgi:hypothetical protein